jgi:hypothetical protein
VNDGTRRRNRKKEVKQNKKKQEAKEKRIKTQIFPVKKLKKNFFFGEREASHYTIGVTVDSLWNPLLCCCFFFVQRGKPL